MTKKQRESSAKYLYDLSKGNMLLTVVGPLVTKQASWSDAAWGIAGTLLLFAWAFRLEGKT